MTTAPGWYPTDKPDTLRWWDGERWTSHESNVVGVQSAGWYPVSPATLRWWDGKKWSGMRVKNGVPGIDWATAEKPAIAWTLGFVFFALAASQLTLGVLGDQFPFVAVLMFFVSALWFAVAAQATRVQRIPAPTTPPVAPDEVRPLPGEHEADGAGWFAVAPRVTRWWTGARWAEYTTTLEGIRPTFHSARAYRTLQWMSWGLLGLGVAAIAAGILMLAIEVEAPVGVVVAIMLIVGGAIFAILGTVFVFTTKQYRLSLLLPEAPPA